MSVSQAASRELLIERARNPALPLREQHDAFAQLVEQSQHLVFGWALSSLRSVEEARDAAQDTFMTAWRCLPQLREAPAFPGWLKRIVATHCRRRLRLRAREAAPLEAPESVQTEVNRTEHHSLVASAIASLPAGERHVMVLFYFLGHTQEETARLLGLKSGTVGKRLHSARLKIRRRLPPSVRRAFVPLAQTRSFIEEVRLGIFDDYVGEYRFERRPDLVVSIVKRGDSLVSHGGGQSNLLVSLDDETLVTSHYDGEGRFRRDRRGRVTHFVYYEFGKRLGIARKTRISPPP